MVHHSFGMAETGLGMIAAQRVLHNSDLALLQGHHKIGWVWELELEELHKIDWAWMQVDYNSGLEHHTIGWAWVQVLMERHRIGWVWVRELRVLYSFGWERHTIDLVSELVPKELRMTD